MINRLYLWIVKIESELIRHLFFNKQDISLSTVEFSEIYSHQFEILLKHSRSRELYYRSFGFEQEYISECHQHKSGN